MEPLLNAGDVARALGISVRTFESLLSRGEGPVFVKVGRQRRWANADIHLWLQANRGVHYQAKPIDSTSAKISHEMKSQ